LADIMTMIEDYENNVLNSIAGFIKAVLGLPIYIKDKPFTAPETPYATLRIVTANTSGGWGQRYMYADEMFSYITDDTYQVEIMLYRGRPMPAMSYLLSAFMSLDELKYQTMYSKGVSFLSASNIAEANTVLDGANTQLRSRCIFTFNTRVVIEDIATPRIEKISYAIENYRDTYDDPIPLDYNDLTFVYVTT